MEPVKSQLVESDLHRLDLRFAPLRIQQARAVEALARSMESSGQLTPVVAVAEDTDCWVLVDGYLRIAALRRAGRDTAWVELWDCALHQALVWVLTRVQARPWQAIEEACVVRELVISYDQSQRAVARQIGRDVSWVNRRLALVEGLPEALLNAVAQGQLSTWAATRILAPLAHAVSMPSSCCRPCGASLCPCVSCSAGTAITSARTANGASSWSSNRACFSRPCAPAKPTPRPSACARGPRGSG